MNCFLLLWLLLLLFNKNVTKKKFQWLCDWFFFWPELFISNTSSIARPLVTSHIPVSISRLIYYFHDSIRCWFSPLHPAPLPPPPFSICPIGFSIRRVKTRKAKYSITSNCCNTIHVRWHWSFFFPNWTPCIRWAIVRFYLSFLSIFISLFALPPPCPRQRNVHIKADEEL